MIITIDGKHKVKIESKNLYKQLKLYEKHGWKITEIETGDKQ